MTTKEYKAIAGAIRVVISDWSQDGHNEHDAPLHPGGVNCTECALIDAVNAIANTLEALDKEKFPHKFDRAAFLAACEPQREPVGCIVCGRSLGDGVEMCIDCEEEEDAKGGDDA